MSGRFSFAEKLIYARRWSWYEIKRCFNEVIVRLAHPSGKHQRQTKRASPSGRAIHNHLQLHENCKIRRKLLRALARASPRASRYLRAYDLCITLWKGIESTVEPRPLRSQWLIPDILKERERHVSLISLSFSQSISAREYRSALYIRISLNINRRRGACGIDKKVKLNKMDNRWERENFVFRKLLGKLLSRWLCESSRFSNDINYTI